MLRFIRLFLVILIVIFSSIIGILCALLRPFHPNNTWLFARLIGIPSLWVLGVKLEIRNAKWLNLVTPSVLMSNHQDNMDVLTFAQMTPKGAVTLGKKDILKVPVFGLFYWLSGNILIDRKNRTKAFQALNKAVDALTKRNTSIWIFPEGTRNRKSTLLPFKKGAFHTAIKAGVPIIAVSVSSYSKKMNLNKWKAGKVIMEVHEPIQTSSYEPSDILKLMEHTREIIQSGMDRINT